MAEIPNEPRSRQSWSTLRKEPYVADGPGPAPIPTPRVGVDHRTAGTVEFATCIRAVSYRAWASELNDPASWNLQAATTVLEPSGS